MHLPISAWRNTSTRLRGKSKKAGNKPRECKPRSLSIEPLEARELLSVAPTVTNVTPSAAVVTAANVGTDTFTVVVKFDENMNIGVNPTISFTADTSGTPSGTVGLSANPTGTLTFDSNPSHTFWWDYTHFQATYTVANVDAYVPRIGIGVTGAVDADANTQTPYQGTDDFQINMASNPPMVVHASPKLNPVTLDNVGTDQFWVRVHYSPNGAQNAMATENPPAITLWDGTDPNDSQSAAIGQTLVAHHGNWMNSPVTDYIEFYDVVNTGAQVTYIQISVSGAQNADGYDQAPAPDANVLGSPTAPAIDMTISAPLATVASVVPSHWLVTPADQGSDTFSLWITYTVPAGNHDMQLDHGPTINFWDGVDPDDDISQDIRGSLDLTGSSWSTWQSYTAACQFDFTVVAPIPSTPVYVDLSQATDQVGNDQVPWTSPSAVFQIDTADPTPPVASVASLLPNATSVTADMVGTSEFRLRIQYDQDMDFASTPQIEFQPPGVTLSPHIWTTYSDPYISQWTASRVYYAYYDVYAESGGSVVPNVSVTVSDAVDDTGRTQDLYTQDRVFDLDTATSTLPSVTGVTCTTSSGTWPFGGGASVTTLTDANVGTDKFIVTVGYDEPMYGNVPTITFYTVRGAQINLASDLAAVADTLVFDPGQSGWYHDQAGTDCTTPGHLYYQAVYNVVDAEALIPFVGVSVKGAKDPGLNPQWWYDSPSGFAIDNTPPPQDVTATGVSQTEVDLAWTEDSAYATGFEVQWGSGADIPVCQWTTLATLPSTARSYDNTGLTEGTVRYYRVLALSAYDQSAYSDDVAGASEPTAPSGLTCTKKTGDEIDLTWTNVSQRATAYAVDLLMADNTWQEIDEVAPDPSGTTTDPIPGPFAANTTSHFEVRALTDYSSSNPSPASTNQSPSVTVTTPAWAAPPTNVAANVVSPGEIDFSWDASADATGYNVFVTDLGYQYDSAYPSFTGTYTDTVAATNPPQTTYTYGFKASGQWDGTPTATHVLPGEAYSFAVAAVKSGVSGASASEPLDDVQASDPYAPGFSSGPSADPITVHGTTTTLMATAALPCDPNNPTDPNRYALFMTADAYGKSLTYTWSLVSVDPAGGDVFFDDGSGNDINGTSNATGLTATFTAAGVYDLRVTETDVDGKSVYNDVEVTVNQTLTNVAVTDAAMVLAGGSANLVATAYDQFGNPMVLSTAAWSWSLAGDPSGAYGSLTPGGEDQNSNACATYGALSTANAHESTVTVSAEVGTISKHATADVGIPGCGAYVYHVQSTSYTLNNDPATGGTLTGSVSTTEIGWVTGSSPVDALGQALSVQLTYTPTNGSSTAYTLAQFLANAGSAGYGRADTTYTLRAYTSSTNYYEFHVQGMVLQQMTMSEHGNAANTATATALQGANLVVPGDDNGVGYIDLSGLFSTMTTGATGSLAQVNVTITRNEGLTTTTILSGTYAGLLAAGELNDVPLPTIDPPPNCDQPQYGNTFYVAFAFADADGLNVVCGAAPGELGGSGNQGGQPATVQVVSFTLKHETAFPLPEPTNRTTIGIGEAVKLAVQGPASGQVKWERFGPGNLSDWSSKDPDWPERYTAPLSPGNELAAVRAIIPYTDGMGITHTITRTVAFTILIPTGVVASVDKNPVIGVQAGLNNFTWVGAETRYVEQVLPNTVNFANVDFREDIPEQTFAFPDGTPFTMYPKAQYPQGFISTFNCHSDSSTKIVNITSPPDRVYFKVLPAGVVNLKRQGIYQNWQYDVNVPLQFLSDYGWKTFTTEVHRNVFVAATLQSYVSVITGDPPVDVEGGHQGPWQ